MSANLPEQIRKQVEEAEKIIKSTASGDTPAPEPASEPAPEPASEPAPEAISEPNLNDDPNNETYAQRWKSLQGIYNATVKRERDLAARVQQLESVLATIQSQPNASTAPAQQPAQQPTSTKYVTDADVQEYGDAIDMMRRVAREELQPVIAQVNATLQQFNQQVSKQVSTVAHQTSKTQEEIFFQKLSAAVPNWAEVNGNPDFHQWLLEADPLTGIQRQTYLDNATQAYDVARVINIFSTWMNSQNVAPAAPSAPASTQPAASGMSELEKQVAPGRGRSAAPPKTASQGRIWTRQDISNFYNDIRQGKFKDRESERRQLEQDIFVAQREGRIA